MKKKKIEANSIIPGVVYEFSPEEAEELGAFFDPAANELSLTETEDELKNISEKLAEIETLESKE
jgi:hypothetical protein